MTPAQRVAEWLGVRRSEVSVVLLSFAGAFLVMSFLVLARSLREAAYLARFDASTLPYVMGGVALLGFPAAALFGRGLDRVSPRRAMRALSLALAVAVAALWPALPGSGSAVVAFYLLTAIGTALLTSGFWLVVSEMLVVREAKRLFGLISAGGTVGILVTGLGVGAAATRVEPSLLVPALVFFLLASAALNEFVPRDRVSAEPSGGSTPWATTVGLVVRDPHVRTLTLAILLVAAVGTIVDFQFKEAAQRALVGESALAGFFGSFYGWTGGLALLVQLLLTTRIMTRGGIPRSIALMPALLLVLSAGMLALPGLLLATGLRGTEQTLKKSLFRSVVEFLWVPVRSDVRRRTKTFVDTVAENIGDASGAVVVLLLVTLGGLPSRLLSIVVILGCGALLVLARRMGTEYFATLRARLAEGLSGETLAARRPFRNLEPRTLSQLDVTRLLRSVEGERPEASDPHRPAPAPDDALDRTAAQEELEDPPDELWTMLPALDDRVLRERLSDPSRIDAADAPRLALLLARDGLRDLAVRRLVELGSAAAPALAEIVADETGDFVVRRRAAQVLGLIAGETSLDGLLAGLSASRFEIRYRSARSLAQRQRAGEAFGERPREAVWGAIRAELSRGRAVWELARLLDAREHDELAGGRAVERGELSLEHVFRMLSLVLDRDAIRAAWRGVTGEHAELGSLALEYLEQVLPEDVRRKLWPFIGDLSAEQSRRAIRPLDAVISDLLVTGATLFRGDDRDRLQLYLRPDEPDTGGGEPDGGTGGGASGEPD